MARSAPAPCTLPNARYLPDSQLLVWGHVLTVVLCARRGVLATQVVADMINDELKLGYFSPMDGWSTRRASDFAVPRAHFRNPSPPQPTTLGLPFLVAPLTLRPLVISRVAAIHITDLDPHSLAANGGLEDVSLVKKYEISDDDYNKREDNFRKWRAGKKAADPSWTLAKEVKQNQDKKRMEQDPNFVPEPAKAPVTDDEHLADLAGGMKVGDRCEVTVGGKRGLVQYVGKIPQIAPGWWVGVQYDEPVGKNDGTVKGRKYFDCPPKYGGFLRPDKLSVGDYPELDDLFTDDEADDEAENAVAAS